MGRTVRITYTINGDSKIYKEVYASSSVQGAIQLLRTAAGMNINILEAHISGN